MTEPQRYRAYILRLWLAEGDDGRPVWRAALEDAPPASVAASPTSEACSPS